MVVSHETRQPSRAIQIRVASVMRPFLQALVDGNPSQAAKVAGEPASPQPGLIRFRAISRARLPIGQPYKQVLCR